MYAINYAMSDIYGGMVGTTEITVPDESDKKVLETEDTKTVVKETTKKSSHLYLTIVLIVVIAVIMGALK